MNTIEFNFADHASESVLGKGTHTGFAWLILSNGGFRCGYVRVPDGHPWHGEHYDNVKADCHGGLTYCQQWKDGYWLGFDCAHWDDAPDPSLPGADKLKGMMTGEVRSQGYVQEQCEKLCEQAFHAQFIT